MSEIDWDGTQSAWLVRGGEYGQREARALAEGLMIAGWAELGNIGSYHTREEIREALKSTYPDVAENVIANWTGQLWRFAKQISLGDLVVMPLHTQPGKVAIGRVEGPYEYKTEEPEGFRQVRRVEWLRTDIPREAFGTDLRASISSLLTVCGLTRNEAARRIAFLAEHGVDPGMDGAEEITTADELLEDAASRDPGNPRQLTIRSFLEHWGQARRIGSVEATIKRDLADKGLTTRPSFMEGSLDDEIAIIPARVEPDTSSTAEPEEEAQDAQEHEPATHRISGLPPSKLESVKPTESLELVQTKMLDKKYSQLGVIDDDGKFCGVVSWESIGKAHIAYANPTLEQATVPAVTVDHHAPLLEQIGVIYGKGFVLVRGTDGVTVDGIVTAADLTRQFGDLARPFMLVEEVESRLCLREDKVFSLDELREAEKPYKRAGIQRAADFTLGTHFHLLKEEKNWAKLGWNVDHQFFLDKLREVTKIRNGLMHYSPDPTPADIYDKIEGLLEILRAADPRLERGSS
jgi:restriction system protein